jgi:uncharacterized protein YcbK (DUF882 family)
MNRPGAHFSWSEFTRSDTATKLGISNEPTPAHRANIARLCAQVLDPLRVRLGRPVRITSGYRSAAVNAALKGASSTSQHMVGEAADLKVDGMSAEQLAAAIVALGVEFDQVIWYAADNGGQVHVSFTTARRNRRQTLHSPRPKVYVAWTPIPAER